MKLTILTDPQRHALHVACRKPGAIIRPPFTTLEPKREITRHMAGTLVEREWVTIVETRIQFDTVSVAVITTTGRQVLAAPVEEPPRLLARRIGTSSGDYTTELHLGAWDAGEGVSVDEIAAWSSEAIQNRDAQQSAEWHRALSEHERAIASMRALAVNGDKRLLHEVELAQRRADAIRRKLAA